MSQQKNAQQGSTDFQLRNQIRKGDALLVKCRLHGHHTTLALAVDSDGYIHFSKTGDGEISICPVSDGPHIWNHDRNAFINKAGQVLPGIDRTVTVEPGAGLDYIPAYEQMMTKLNNPRFTLKTLENLGISLAPTKVYQLKALAEMAKDDPTGNAVRTIIELCAPEAESAIGQNGMSLLVNFIQKMSQSDRYSKPSTRSGLLEVLFMSRMTSDSDEDEGFGAFGSFADMLRQQTKRSDRPGAHDQRRREGARS